MTVVTGEQGAVELAGLVEQNKPLSAWVGDLLNPIAEAVADVEAVKAVAIA